MVNELRDHDVHVQHDENDGDEVELGNDEAGGERPGHGEDDEAEELSQEGQELLQNWIHFFAKLLNLFRDNL